VEGMEIPTEREIKAAFKAASPDVVSVEAEIFVSRRKNGRCQVDVEVELKHREHALLRTMYATELVLLDKYPKAILRFNYEQSV
jgi:hypothetical protein